jgi:hypothetical protein
MVMTCLIFLLKERYFLDSSHELLLLYHSGGCSEMFDVSYSHASLNDRDTF